MPLKPIADAPFSRHDGGGISSTADWSYPQENAEDIFKPIRQDVFAFLLSSGAFRMLQRAFHEKQSSTPFPTTMVTKFQEILHSFFEQWDKTLNWTIPPDQPMYLHILRSLSEIMADPDIHLFDHLVAGVPTGFQNDIPLSNCFLVVTDPVDNSHVHLSVHQTNRKFTEDNIEIVRELVQDEIDAGWVEEFQGSLGDAQTRWPLGDGKTRHSIE